MIQLDTHVVGWLYAGKLDLLPPSARQYIDENELSISPMVLLELEYLKEIGRTTQPAQVVIDDLSLRIGLKVSSTSLCQITPSALQLSWTRDPFDRIIVGHAMADGCRLLTADRTIHQHFENAIWA